MKTRDLRAIVSFAALMGLVVALFAAAEFYNASLRSICSVSSFFSCAAVDTSGKTTTLGVPDFLWGVGGFVALFVVALLAERRKRDVRLAYALVGLATAGVAMALYLLYIELARIHALCLVCATDYLLVGIVWIGSIAVLGRVLRRRREDAGPTPGPSA